MKRKIGLFGGSFNPPHMGHVSLVRSVTRKLGLHQVIVIPNLQNPLKSVGSDLTIASEHRYHMTRLAFEELRDLVEVWDGELKRPAPSYTIDSIKEWQKLAGDETELYLLIGVDNLERLNEWKNWQDIITQVHLVVTSRPGWPLPYRATELPEFLQDLVARSQFNEFELSTGKKLIVTSIPEVAISSTDIRRLYSQGKQDVAHVPLPVQNYILERQLYAGLRPKAASDEALLTEVVGLLEDRKLFDIRRFDLRQAQGIADFVVIASGTSSRHVSQSAEYTMLELKKRYSLLPVAQEGLDTGNWVVMDYGNIMIHLFEDNTRRVYKLEDLLPAGSEIK